MRKRDRIQNGVMGLLLCGAMLGGVSCTSLKAEVQDEELQDVDDSLSLAAHNVTKYSDALDELGMMVTAYGCPAVRIQVRSIENKTADKKLPGDVSQMTITALNKIGPQMQIVDFDKDQLGIDLALGKQTMERIAPDIAMRGAITEFDKKVEKSKSLEADVEGTTAGKKFGFGGGYDTDANGVTAAMDYQFLDYQKQILLPGVQAANRINLFQTEKGGDFGLKFEGSGAKFKAKVKKTQGLHAAIRLLVEMSVAELVGEYYQLPYWRVLPGVTADQDMIDAYRRSLGKGSERVLKKKVLAYAYGKDVDPFSAETTSEEEDEFRALREELNIDETVSDTEFIVQMWLNLPVEKAASRMRTYQTEMVRAHEEQKAREAQMAAQQAAEAAQLQAQQEAQAAQIAAQQAAEAQRQAELQQKRTTFKFGKQDTF